MRSHTAAVILVLSIVAAPSRAPAADPKQAAAKILVSFKLDPRLAGGTYGGERWVSPATFQGAAAQDTVEVQARAVDAHGAQLRSGVEWAPSDPELVSVSPSRGDVVKITVKRAGKSSLVVKAGEASRKLTVEAAQSNGAWQVYISQ